MKQATFAALFIGLAAACAMATPKIVASSTETTFYAVSTPTGVTQQGAWAGFQISQNDDGTCIKETHTDLKITKDPSGKGDSVSWKTDLAPVQCPGLITN